MTDLPKAVLLILDNTPAVSHLYCTVYLALYCTDYMSLKNRKLWYNIATFKRPSFGTTQKRHSQNALQQAQWENWCMNQESVKNHKKNNNSTNSTSCCPHKHHSLMYCITAHVPNGRDMTLTKSDLLGITIKASTFYSMSFRNSEMSIYGFLPFFNLFSTYI